MDLSIIHTYFPDLSEKQKDQLGRFSELFIEWNTKVNCISRKDVDHIVERHILHSLSIAKLIDFKPGTRILDIGTGGGFPGIPLAIFFPKVDFVLVDSIGKKIKVVNDIADQLSLKNVIGIHTRAENVKGSFDFIVSRAVTRLVQFLPWTRNKISTKQKNSLKNGILYLKGGDLTEELAETKRKHVLYPISDYFKEAFFETKKIVYIPFS